MNRVRTSMLGALCAVLTLCGLAGSAQAAGGDQPPTAPPDPVIEQVEAAIARKDWTGAAAIMKTALARAPDNAEYHNRYAFALRKGPKPDMAIVFRHYREALRLEPEHRGAHEYIGEAYLMVGDLAKAREHLGVLERLCFFGCEEYDDLKKAIAGYEASAGKRP